MVKLNINYVGNGKVVLIAGGGKVYTDVAARFTKTEKSLDEILASPYDKNIVKNIIEMGHLAATEFDYFIFGIEGYARVTEVQLVRKRIANYLIKSGRVDKNGKRSFDMIIPKGIEDFIINYPISSDFIKIKNNNLSDVLGYQCEVNISLDCYEILSIIENWYNTGIKKEIPEEDLRYMKPQATEFKAIIGMNTHSLLDFFRIRCCKNSQTEIRDLANKMLKECKKVSPDLFKKAGSNCVHWGFCPENQYQNKNCVGKILTHNDVINKIKNNFKENNIEN